MSIETPTADAAVSAANRGSEHFGIDASTPSTVTAASTASPEFVLAISEYLDTDPTDLLQELGYYERGIRAND